MTGADDVQKAAFTFDKSMDEMALKRIMELDTPADFSCIQTIPPQEFNLSSRYHMKYSLYRNAYTF